MLNLEGPGQSPPHPPFSCCSSAPMLGTAVLTGNLKRVCKAQELLAAACLDVYKNVSSEGLGGRDHFLGELALRTIHCSTSHGGSSSHCSPNIYPNAPGAGRCLPLTLWRAGVPPQGGNRISADHLTIYLQRSPSRLGIYN